MSASGEDYCQFLTGSSLRVQRATSKHLSAIHPMFPEGGIIDKETGLKVPGIYIGQCGRDGSGGIFLFDTYQLYQAGIIHNLNTVLLGEIDHRKSSLVKTYILRSVAHCYNVLVTDIKGEYTPLAEVIEGSKILKFGPDSGLCINPLDKRIALEHQIELIKLLAVGAMGDDHQFLTTREEGLLKWAIMAAHERYTPDTYGLASGQAIMPNLVAKLNDPDDYMTEGFGRDRTFLKDLGLDMAIGLQKLTEGQLGSMCGGETTAGLYEDTPLVVMNLKDVPDSMLPVVVTIYNFFISSQFGKANSWGRIHHVIHDEAWRLVENDSFVQSLIQTEKLGRTEGVSVMTVFHHLQTLYRAGKHAAIKELVTDAATRIIYAQNDTEVELTKGELNLTDNEADLIPHQPPGNGLWKIGKDFSLEVQHRAFPFEIPLLETSHRIKGLDV